MQFPKEDLCFICKVSLKEGEIAVVKERGVNRLRESSAKRRIKDHTFFLKDLKEVRVHTKCQKHYNNDKLIVSALQKGESNHASGPSRRSSGPAPIMFEIENHCFLCGAEVPTDFEKKQRKLPFSRRDHVYMCGKLSQKHPIVSIAKARRDQWSQEIIERIAPICEGINSTKDAMYHRSCYIKLYSRLPSNHKRGHRSTTNIDEAMDDIFCYLEENSDECQFSLEQLMSQIEGDFCPDSRTVKTRLLKHYGEEILIAETCNRSSVLCFKNTGYKILSDSWYNDREKKPEEERLRVVKAAAEIILEDIRSQVYDTSEYPPPDNFLQDAESVIPQSLMYFMENVIFKYKRGQLDPWKKKCVALSHAVISAVRPRSFVSSLLTGVGTYLYKKFGSKLLVNILSSLGFSSSYDEVSRFELSAIAQPRIKLDENAFCQFVFDNADFNINTLNGEGTFHAMGGIIAVTPSTSVVPSKRIERMKKLPSSQSVFTEFGSVPMQVFHRMKNSGLETITVKNIESHHPLPTQIMPSSSDLIWLYAKWSNCDLIPGWNGFMEEVTADRHFETSKIIVTPFINAPPSNYDTILTSLLEAVNRKTPTHQKSCIVTFDQPLYLKARDIVCSGQDPRLNNIILRLGGFHMLMSYMGAIGFIMAGSGLKDMLSCIYAENSLEKILAGHAYSRAIRAHILVHRALSKIIFDSIEITEEERAEMNSLILSYDSVILSASDNPHYQSITRKFNETLKEFEQNGSTAKLWVQYFRMTTLMKQFIEAERTGDWQLHLNTVQRMLPYFHASGHFHYAKCGQLYLQDMLALENTMEPAEFEKFTAGGYFTIRRTHKFWSGIWSDMTIEQTLMKTMKSSGGLTRGRGINNSVLTRWTLGLAVLQNVCDEVERFCDNVSATTEQHVDMRPSRVCRDDTDANKIMMWFSTHNPFPKIPDIMSISNGLIGGDEVNCHISFEIGNAGMAKIVNENFNSIHFKRKDVVVSLATVTNNIKTSKGKVAIDPLMLFHRIIVSKKSDDDLKEFFQFELAPFPLSLFSEDGLRKGTKSSFYHAFTPLTTQSTIGSKVEVIDGGFLLHKVYWDRSETFSSIFKKYVAYVQHHHGRNAVVVFDGYPAEEDRKSTKSAERARRSRLSSTAEVIFDETMHPQMPKEKFLANEKNKSRFITFLQLEFERAGMATIQASEDADVLIVSTAKNLSSDYDSVCVIGEDIDLLVLINAFAPDNVYFCKVGKGKISDTFYSNKSFKYGDISENILFLHAVGGCDTTSALFGQGKIKFCTTLEKFPCINESVKIFKDPNAEKETLFKAMEPFLVALYGGEHTFSLNDLRYLRFAQATTSNKFNLARLPPTEDAAKYHTWRVYFQVQAWMGIEKDPTNWGWKQDLNGLNPVPMLIEPAPQSLISSISCQCKKACVAKCSCIKAGLKCSVVCLHCNETSCGNMPEAYIEEDNIEDEEAALFDEVDGVEPTKKKSKL